MAGIISKQNGMKGGRPKGSTTKPHLSDYLSEKQVIKLVKKATEMAEKGDTLMLKFVLEQHFGKAIQPIGNAGNKPFIVQFDNAFTPSTEVDSGE